MRSTFEATSCALLRLLFIPLRRRVSKKGSGEGRETDLCLPHPSGCSIPEACHSHAFLEGEERERERATTLKPRAVCVVVGNFHIATLVDAPSIAVLFCQPRYETSGVHSKRRRHVDATSEVARADKHTQPRTRRERRTRALAFLGGRPGQARHCKDREEARQSKNRPPLPDRCAHGAQPPGTCKPPPIPTAAHAHAP